MGSLYTTNSAQGAVAITPSDSADINKGSRALICGGSGMITADFVDGSNAAFYVAAGVVIPVAVTKIYSTGTDASSIVALY